MEPVTPDPQPGAYYVSVVDADRKALLAGPFDTHAEALALVEPTRKVANELDPKSHFYGFGTCRLPVGADKPGLLNQQMGL